MAPNLQSLEDAEASKRRNSQDKRVTHLIHVKDGRLMPNMPKLRFHPHYRPYTGKLNASHEERMAYLVSGGSSRHAAVVDTTVERAPDAPVDVGKMSVPQLRAFALDEFGLKFDTMMSAREMRTRLKAADQARRMSEATQGGEAGIGEPEVADATEDMS